MDKQHDIFLSYSSEDRSRAAKIVEALEERDYKVWWDQHIPHGVTWDNCIEENLSLSKIVVVLWSEKSIQSDWVKNEAREGNNKNNEQVLLPVRIDDCAIPLEFRSVQTADLIDWEKGKTHKEFDKFINSIGLTLNEPNREKEIKRPLVAEQKPKVKHNKKPFYLQWQYLFVLLLVFLSAFWFVQKNYFDNTELSEKLTPYKNENKNKFGFEDKDGNIVIASQFDSVQEFKGGKALVFLGSHGFYINETGECIAGDCPKETIVTSPKKEEKAGALTDQEEWDLAIKTNSRSGYILYAFNFPKGKYIKEANRRIQKFDQEERDKEYNGLIEKAEDAFKKQNYDSAISFYQKAMDKSVNNKKALDGLLKVESIFWEKAKTESTLESYELYKKKYPNGKHVREASKRIELLTLD